MAIVIDKRNIPVQFEALEYVKDDRFQKVKIWVAHTGQNLNRTVFSKDVLSDMSKTLPYIPIVGFIEKNSSDEDDFSDHRQRIIIEKNKVDIEYMCNAYGFVPEKPEVEFEFRDGKEWLTCIGYLWTKFTKSIDIFDNANGSKSQSMEIDDVDGEVDEKGNLVFSKGRFSALCILGEDVNPAMAGSTIEYFSNSGIKDMVREMIHQFSMEKGAEGLKNNDEKVFETESNEVFETEEQNVEDTETESFEEQKEDKEKEEVEDEKETESFKESESSDKEEDEEEKDKETFSENVEVPESYEFSQMSYEKRKNKVQNRCYEEGLGTINQMYEDYVITHAYDWDINEYKYKKCKYEIDGAGNVTIGDTVDVFAQFLTSEEVSAVEAYNAKVATLEAELESLRKFKSDFELSEKQEVLNAYAEQLTTDEVKGIEAKFSEMDVEQVKDKIGALLFRKMSKPEKPSSGIKLFSVEKPTKTDGRYGEFDKYFTK